jgi:hypothetical protein
LFHCDGLPARPVFLSRRPADRRDRCGEKAVKKQAHWQVGGQRGSINAKKPPKAFGLCPVVSDSGQDGEQDTCGHNRIFAPPSITLICQKTFYRSKHRTLLANVFKLRVKLNAENWEVKFTGKVYPTPDLIAGTIKKAL